MKVVLIFLRLGRSAPLFELVGSGMVIAGVYLGTQELWAALVTAGGLTLLKSFDLAMEETEKPSEGR